MTLSFDKSKNFSNAIARAAIDAIIIEKLFTLDHFGCGSDDKFSLALTEL
jgi:sialic acid synthase SpsE